MPLAMDIPKLLGTAGRFCALAVVLGCGAAATRTSTTPARATVTVPPTATDRATLGAGPKEVTDEISYATLEEICAGTDESDRSAQDHGDSYSCAVSPWSQGLPRDLPRFTATGPYRALHQLHVRTEYSDGHTPVLELADGRFVALNDANWGTGGGDVACSQIPDESTVAPTKVYVENGFLVIVFEGSERVNSCIWANTFEDDGELQYDVTDVRKVVWFARGTMKGKESLGTRQREPHDFSNLPKENKKATPKKRAAKRPLVTPWADYVESFTIDAQGAFHGTSSEGPH